MKPRHLKIEGFLSYQQPVEIDFTEFDLACITGDNGAGKSSILDAMTWVLFGKARQSNESLINLQSDEAIVTFSFEYSGESYKIKRSNKRGKPARLTLKTPELDLTERTTRDTQNKIEQILKIDYETFCHAVFFLQGDSDKFVTATPGKRKQVLFDILGLDAWEKFRQNAAAEIKTIEKSMEQAQGSVQVLEEDIRRSPEVEKDLKTVEDEMPECAGVLKSAEVALAIAQTKKNEYVAWKNDLHSLGEDKANAVTKRLGIGSRIEGLQNEQQENSEIISRKDQIIKDYARSRELTQLLTESRTKDTEYGKLKHSLSGLEGKLQEVEDDLLDIPEYEKSIVDWKKNLEIAIHQKEQILEYEKKQYVWNQTEKNIEHGIQLLHQQIEDIEGEEACPLCKQQLENPDILITEKLNEIKNLKLELKQLLDDHEKAVAELPKSNEQIIPTDELHGKIANTKQTILSIQKVHKEFDLDELRDIEEKIELLDHDLNKSVELLDEAKTLFDAPREHGLLEGAEKAGDSLEAQIKALEQDLFDAEATVKEYQNQIESKEDQYADDPSPSDHEMADLARGRDEAKARLEAKQMRVGELSQILKTIADQKKKLKEIQEKEKENTELHQKYSVLQEAFSKKGVPALLVEQSLPQIESKANQLLHRLSDGDMAVHFITQKSYSDASREDMQETLDIEIQDQFGIRDYEMYSGGESFRINFAIRMALSNVLANRAGAKLRTLVIDEGFGSQDAGGRDRLINAINTVKEEYDKVLVITHIPEVIESFPVQIRVEKTAAGSQVRIL